MSTAPLVPHVRPLAATRPTRAGLLVAEWVKLRSLRSTWILLAAVVVLLIAVPAFSAVGAVVQGASRGPSGEADVLAATLAGVSPVEFLVAALGALAVTGEYSSGLIRVTLAAVPRRLPVLLAKALVVGAAILVTAVVSVLAAFVAVRLVLASAGLSASAGVPAVLTTALSAGAYLSGLALIGMAFGWMVRSTVGALAAFFGFLYVPPLLAMIPGGQGFAPFLPSNAGAALLHGSVADPVMATRGGLVFAAWVTALLVVAALVLRRRDA
jgi:ABC-type transport system involved in multi-copper enzyme maturation permease subunit